MQWLENDTAPDLTLADPNYPYSAEASFELPVTSDTLFLVSRSLMRNHGGLFSGGGVEYVQSADISDSVKVDVTARFKNHEHLEASKACLLERNETAKGVGIFVRCTLSASFWPTFLIAPRYDRHRPSGMRVDITTMCFRSCTSRSR
jgi:hypothetical protein